MPHVWRTSKNSVESSRIPRSFQATQVKFSIMFIMKIIIKGEQGGLEGGGVWFS